tara:strand:+ start:161 stop:418 length:258 start_codon:yes stop_codon:yes gene_type:complete
MAAQAVAADQLTTTVVWDVQEEQEILLLPVRHKELTAVMVPEQVDQAVVAVALLTLGKVVADHPHQKVLVVLVVKEQPQILFQAE